MDKHEALKAIHTDSTHKRLVYTSEVDAHAPTTPCAISASTSARVNPSSPHKTSSLCAPRSGPAQRVFVLLAFVPAHARHVSQALAHEGRARLPHRQGQGRKGARPRPLYARAPSNSGLRQFSVDDFEACKTTPWEGVRNFEARNLMREMKVGDKVSGRPKTPPSREGSP